MMPETRRQQCDRRLGSLKTERSGYITQWKDLSDYILPLAPRFLVTDRNKTRNNNKIIDNTATLAARTLASGMMSGITSPARPWFQLRTEDPDLNEFQPVKVYLDLVRQRMTESFLRSNLYTTLPIVYSDLGVFGTHATALLEDPHDTIRAYAFPIGSYCLGTSYRGNVDSCYREFQMTVSQVVGQFGLENVSSRVKTMWDRSNYDAWIDVVHVVEPNPDHDPAKPHSKFKAFSSLYYEAGRSEKEFLSEKGYDEFPILAPRWQVTGEDVYGYSPGMMALGDIKALQVEQRRKAQGIDRAVNPPVNIPVSMRNVGANTLPGGVNVYNDAGPNPGVQSAFMVNPYINELMQDIQENQGRIRKAFFEDLFLMMAGDDRSGITATEIQIRQEEKVLALGPVLERLNDELLDPLIDRTFAIMNRAGLFPPPPPELQGVDLSVEYISILAQAQKLSSVGGIQQTAQFAMNMAAFDPSARHKFDALQAVNAFGDAVGVDPKLIRSQEQVDRLMASEQQAQQVSQALAMAQQGADTAKTLSETNTTDPSALQQMQQQFGGGAA